MSIEPTQAKRPSHRRTVLIVAALLLVFGCGSCVLVFALTPSANRTSVSEQEDERSQPAASDSAESTSTPVVKSAPAINTEAPPRPTDTLVPASDPTVYVTGNNMSIENLPEGESGLTVVVAGQPSSSGVVPLVIRNNTEAPAYDIELSATARDTAGNVLGTGSGDDIVPAYVPPGGIAIGRALFGDTPLDDAAIEYVITADDASGFLFSRRDMTIVEHNWVGENVVGVMRNPHNTALDLTKAVAMCFDEGFTPMSIRIEFTDQGRVEAGGQLPYSIDMRTDESQCGRYLIVGTGLRTD